VCVCVCVYVCVCVSVCVCLCVILSPIREFNLLVAWIRVINRVISNRIATSSIYNSKHDTKLIING
jgi:hypothetical protein